MIQTVNSKYRPLFTDSWWRYGILMGGRGAGRSTVASQRGIAKVVAPDYYRCAIMRFVLGDIRNSIYQEILDRADEQEIRDALTIREQLLSIGYGQNRINGVGFRKSSGDQKSKLKSLASYNEVIIEEADEINEEDFMQLDDSLRTLKSDIKIILLLNPPDRNHWIIKRWFNLLPSEVEGFYMPELKDIYRSDTLFIHTTYLDNIVNIDESTRANYERYQKTRPDYYWNMIRGLVSEGARGRVYPNWKVIPDHEFDELPYPSYYGLDFGYSNDPTALIEIKEHNENLWCRELIYETGLLNPQIARRMDELGVDRSAPIYADSQEPKSIEEIRLEDWNILPCRKGADSIRKGIDTVQGYTVHYTESSTNIAKEGQEYRWALDANKEPTNKPIDDFNHAMDGIRYGVDTHNHREYVGFV